MSLRYCRHLFLLLLLSSIVAILFVQIFPNDRPSKLLHMRFLLDPGPHMFPYLRQCQHLFQKCVLATLSFP